METGDPVNYCPKCHAKYIFIVCLVYNGHSVNVGYSQCSSSVILLKEKFINLRDILTNCVVYDVT